MTAILLHTVNFLILAGFLFFIMRKKLAQGYAQQAKDFEEKMKSANQQFEETRSAYEDLKRRSEGLENELASMRRMSMREIENESSRIEKETERLMQVALTDAESRLKVESERIRADLEKQLLEDALLRAQEILSKDLKNQDEEWIGKMIGTPDQAMQGKKNYAS